MNGYNFTANENQHDQKQKRKHDDVDTEIIVDSSLQNENAALGKNADKCKIQEGFSWWTCLQYNMPLDMMGPQAVRQNKMT